MTTLRNYHLKANNPITYICFSVMLLGLLYPIYSVLLGLCISFYLVVRAKLNGLIGIFFLQLSPYYFYDINTSPVDDSSREHFYLIGFPLTVETLIPLFICIRVIYQIFINSKIFHGKISNVLLFLWIISFIPVTIGAYLAANAGLPNWSRGIRWLMISGAYFYGIILSRDCSALSLEKILKEVYIIITFFIIILLFFGYFWSHHVFMLIGFGVALGCYLLSTKRHYFMLLGAIILFFLLQYIINGSLTMYAIFFSTLLLIIFTELNASNNNTKKLIARAVLKITIFIPLFVTIIIISFGNFKGEITELYNVPLDGALLERMYSKSFYDRYPYWQSSLSQVLTSNYLIGNSGSPLELKIPGLPGEWFMGSHNSLLEIPRVTGLFAGLLILWIYVTALSNLIKILLSDISRFVRNFSSALLSTGVIGASLGDFPADMTVGVWLWLFVGISYGLFLKVMAIKERDDSPCLKSSHKFLLG